MVGGRRGWSAHDRYRDRKRIGVRRGGIGAASDGIAGAAAARPGFAGGYLRYRSPRRAPGKDAADKADLPTPELRDTSLVLANRDHTERRFFWCATTMGQAEIDKMIKVFGAPIEPADAAVIVDYLVKNYGTAG